MIQHTAPVAVTLTSDIVQPLQAVLGTDLLPPTLPFLFWQSVEVPWLQHRGPILHGEQGFTYHRPLQLNCTYTVTVTLQEMRQKGAKQFLYHTLQVRDETGVAVTCTSTFILLGEAGL